MSKKVVVVGSINMDLVLRVKEFPLPGQTVMGKDFATFPGGKGANQCIAAARLGAATEMVGRLGDDGYGHELKALFEREGVDCKNLHMLGGVATSTAVIQINDKAENQIIVIPTANYRLDSAALENASDSIKNAGIVMAQLEILPEMVYRLADMCADFNVPLILNPAPAIPLSDELLAKVSYLTPNETELEILSGQKIMTEADAESAAKSLLSKGVKTVITTMGRAGAMIVDNSGARMIPAYTVTAVDTVAAGDSFNGALAACLMNGQNIDSAVRYANAVGALTVSRRGAIPSLPTAQEVSEFLHQQ